MFKRLFSFCFEMSFRYQSQECVTKFFRSIFRFENQFETSERKSDRANRIDGQELSRFKPKIDVLLKECITI